VEIAWYLQIAVCTWGEKVYREFDSMHVCVYILNYMDSNIYVYNRINIIIIIIIVFSMHYYRSMLNRLNGYTYTHVYLFMYIDIYIRVLRLR